MDIKTIALSLFATSLLQSCAPTPNLNEEILFQNYGLAACLGAAFEDKIFKGDFYKSANGYLEPCILPIEAYEERRATAKWWSVKNYISKHCGQINSANCIDFHRTQEISELFKKHSP